MNLGTFTIEDIRSYQPCYDPTRYLPADWTGTALDILKVEAAPVEDRFWVVLRGGWIDERTLRLFAVWCARQALALVDDPDPRSVEAVNVAERFAHGEATREELAAAWAAARVAARNAAWDARVAARNAAWDASAAAWAAARVAARNAAWDASDAARVAARAAAWDAQVGQLIAMLTPTP